MDNVINVFADGTIDIQIDILLSDGWLRIDHEIRENMNFLVLNYWQYGYDARQYQNLDVLNDEIDEQESGTGYCSECHEPLTKNNMWSEHTCLLCAIELGLVSE